MTISSDAHTQGLIRPEHNPVPPSKVPPSRQTAAIDVKPAIPINKDLVLNIDFESDTLEVTPKIFAGPTGRATVSVNMLGDEVSARQLQIDHPGQLTHSRLSLSARGSSLASPTQGQSRLAVRRGATLIQNARQSESTVVTQYGNRLSVDAPGDFDDVQITREGNRITIDHPGTLRNTVITKVGQNISISHGLGVGETLIEASGGGFVIHHADTPQPTRVTGLGQKISISFPHERGETRIEPVKDNASQGRQEPFLTRNPSFPGVVSPGIMDAIAEQNPLGTELPS